jgi:hypothetical protein
LHLLPFVNGTFDVVSTSGGGFGDRPPTVVVVGFGWSEGGIGTGNAPGPDGEGFRFPELPPDPELNPDASEFVAATLARSDKEDSSEKN